MRLRSRQMQVIWALVFVAVAAGIVLYRSSHSRPELHDYTAAKPRVGDRAMVQLQVVKPGLPPEGDKAYRPPTRRDYRYVSFQVECVESRGVLCKFEVRYVVNGKPDKLAYSVAVNYAATSLARQTRVTDRSGKLVKPGSLIDGNPVVLGELLVFNGAYLDSRKKGRRVLLPDGGTGILDRTHHGDPPGDPRDDLWTIRLSGGSNGGVRTEYSVIQLWKAGEWLWMQSQGQCKGLFWYATRQTLE